MERTVGSREQAHERYTSIDVVISAEWSLCNLTQQPPLLSSPRGVIVIQVMSVLTKSYSMYVNTVCTVTYHNYS
jgi:hypothetical protein